MPDEDPHEPRPGPLVDGAPDTCSGLGIAVAAHGASPSGRSAPKVARRAKWERAQTAAPNRTRLGVAAIVFSREDVPDAAPQRPASENDPGGRAGGHRKCWVWRRIVSRLGRQRRCIAQRELRWQPRRRERERGCGQWQHVGRGILGGSRLHWISRHVLRPLPRGNHVSWGAGHLCPVRSGRVHALAFVL